MEKPEQSSRATTLAGDEPKEPMTSPASPRLRAVQSHPDPESQSPSRDPGLTKVGSGPRGDMPTYKWVLILASLYGFCFLYGLDTTIAADIQGAVVSTFGDVTRLAWLGAGFPMGSVSVILMAGSLYGAFNYKWVFVASALLFEAGSAVCGAAPDMNALIVGRAVAGTGGAGIYLGCLSYVAALTDPGERGGYIASIGLFWGLGCVLGPVIGGGFSESAATWRWAFYVNLPVGALVAPVTLFCLPAIRPREGAATWDRVRGLDFVGFLLNTATWVTFCLGFTMAGAQWPWNDGRTIATLVVFGVLVVTYALQQYFAVFTTPETLSFPVHLLRSRSQVLLFAALAANNATMFVVVYFIPIYFQFVHDDTSIMAAVRLLPFVILSVVFNLATGALLSKIRHYMIVYLVSGVLIVAGGAPLMAFLNPSTSQASIYGFTVLMAIGTGITMQLSYSVGPLVADERDQGYVIAFMNVGQIGSTAIALVVAGQIFQSYAAQNLETVLAGQGFSDAEIRGGVAGVRSELFSKLSGELREEAVDAITRAMRRAFALPVVGGAVIIAASLLMKREKLLGKIAPVG